jgi:hypothetical protein
MMRFPFTHALGHIASANTAAPAPPVTRSCGGIGRFTGLSGSAAHTVQSEPHVFSQCSPSLSFIFLTTVAIVEASTSALLIN